MKTIHKIVMSLFFGLLICASCKDDLLNMQATTDLDYQAYWRTEEDAESALMGLYANIKPLFNKDYYLEGLGDYVRTRATSSLSSATFTAGFAYYGGNYNPSGFGGTFDNMYRFLFGGVNRANYVIENVSAMIPNYPGSVASLETIVAEARFMRALAYFRLITMWGDVPYIDWVVKSNSEVINISRTPIAEIRQYILADLNYAQEKLPPTAAKLGRIARPAALALRGKVNLYWACWNKFGWPELDTFTPNAGAADEAYRAAAADFKSVITDFGLTLFRNGEPGEIDELGKADKLPNYFYLFIPSTANSAENKETILGFTHGGNGTGLSESLMRDFAGRDVENSEVNMSPLFWLADRYQSTITGDFVEPLVRINPNNDPEARTKPNSAVNPQSYANRDYRMKATMMWDYEMIQGLSALAATRMFPFVFQRQSQREVINGVEYTTQNYNSGTNSGYLFRKFVRNYPGQDRASGDFTWPVIRLADVFLMYAEASNEAYGPQADAIELVNKVRHRGNLPPLTPSKTASRNAFFGAIEQERIVELVGEGHRIFDMRRWRKIEDSWGAPYGPGKWTVSTWGSNITQFFQNASERTYEQCYIFKIPDSERDRNPNLTQNKPYL